MLGVVRELWRYPVKSMGGEACESLLVEKRGVQGDRRFAVRDAKGRLGSGKTTRRFRPDIVIETDGAGVVELAWIGRRLRVGDEVVLEVAGRTERCAMVALPQGDLEMDPRVLHTLALRTDVCFGVYAHVAAAGSIRFHDSVSPFD